MNQFRTYTFLGLYFIQIISGQENAGSSISPSLKECYNNTPFITIKQYRLPATMNTFIALIRKIEDQNRAVNTRELAIQILQRFRQDGIWKSEDPVDIHYTLPYSPIHWETYKNKVQLKKLTPGNAQTFNNESLNIIERCSLHSFISSTIESHERGDEDVTCRTISRYTLRFKRDVEFSERVSTPSSTLSTCPIESGVVYTKWGAVKAGLILSGIASGFEHMDIPASNRKKVDNRYASTLAGELSEAALYQATDAPKIGAKGDWNSTLVPRYYFLQDQKNLQVTDAEIRGGLDGLYLALNIDSWKSKAPNIKISQLLDLYYSSRGVFNKTMRACNRNLLLTSLLTSEKMKEETANFNFILHEFASYKTTPNEDVFPQLADNAVKSFYNYITSVNDLPCSAEDSVIERASSDVIIFLDTSWIYATTEAFLSYIFENIDVDKYGSSYTIYNGVNSNGIIVNTSNTILDFYEKYNLTEHQKYATGFDFNKVFQTIENYFKNKLDNETSLTDQSNIALLITHITPNENERQFLSQRKDVLKLMLPNLRVLVVGPAAKEAYNDVVFNANSDAFTLLDNADIISLKNTAKSVANRIKQIPKNVVNPKCGSKFSFSESNTFSLDQFVEPQGINYHKIAPNYFFRGSDENRKLKVRGSGYGDISVCMSRTESNPKTNSSGITCQKVNSDEVSYDLKDLCEHESVSTCSPIYISVEGVSSQTSCRENLCRFPDNIKYSITLENVGCASGSERIISSFLLIAIFVILCF